ncbi:MAG: efflux transporter outer membrane subunit [Verrucomicrobia bacterium]|nr:efflux transporter outer membrane subunit [Verrucomicrobiota bacterium]
MATICRPLVIGLWSLVILLSGCAIGPDYKRPAVTAPDNYRSATGPATTTSIANLAWWEIYKDSTLNQLIRTALTNNYDVRIAVTRIDQAREAAAQTRSQFFPQFSYQGDASRGKNQMTGSASPRGGIQRDTVLLTLNMAWEFDLWGRIRRLDEASRAQYLASQEARNGVILSLVASVAQAYFELLELDLALDIGKRSTKSFGESFRLFTRKMEGGAASKLDPLRAEASMSTAAASIPDLERQIVIQENQINILLGRPPGPVPRTAKLLDQTMPPEVPAGLPSALLERRPDIREAEQNLRALNAQIGVTMAEFLPKIGMTTLAGKVSNDLSTLALDTGTAGTWSLAGTATGPIFQAGKLIAQTRQARAAWDQSRLQYEQTVLNALAEVANALITREKLEGVRREQARAVRANSDSVAIATKRYIAGKSSYFEVLDAQEKLFPAENSLAQTELNRRLVIVQLYKALGGGWQHDAPPAPRKWTWKSLARPEQTHQPKETP